MRKPKNKMAILGNFFDRPSDAELARIEAKTPVRKKMGHGGKRTRSNYSIIAEKLRAGKSR
jgi:hypothetical protein